MAERKVEKIAALVIGTAVVILAVVVSPDWNGVGIQAGCALSGRLLYPFFHANILHAALNVWCLLSLVFIYDITALRLLMAYIVAASVPVDTLGTFVCMAHPTVGLSGMVYFLFGSISFEVSRRRYFQLCMAFYIVFGFLFPNTNAWLHLYCYLVGLSVALLNKPVNRK